MKRFFVFSLIFAFAALILALSWKVSGFSDFYVRYVFPLCGQSYGRLTALASFSVGEIMLYVFAGYVGLSALFFVVGLFILPFGKKQLFLASAKNIRVLADLLVVVFLIQVINCFVLYHTTPLYADSQYADFKAGSEELIDLRERLVTRANELSYRFNRDDKGFIVYEGDIKSEAVAAVRRLGDEAKARIKAGTETALDGKLQLLSGYNSKPKPLATSSFFSQQGIAGYFFPFSLEANYNKLMYISNIPDTMCHELSHLKGFIYEDEASFLAYLACVNSGDPFFEYSGILNALSYVNVEIMKLIDRDPSLYDRITKKNELVVTDCIFLTEEVRAKIEKDALLSTETVSAASDAFIDASLTINGVEDGIDSYSRIVDLLLKYYYGEHIDG
ncbi:MAG: DUF3810 domain-containing protein [Lachnospiraceae bacterium]|nr:DUF3810 domain-containing protein [Lachnospiraceae bacterium]